MKSKLTILITIALLLSSGGAFALPQVKHAHCNASVQRKVEAIIESGVLCNSVVGVLAVRSNGDTLVRHNCRIRMVPASNMKVISTGIALRELGRDFRFETRFAYSGAVRDSVLKGDLYIIGGGDPSIGSDADCASVPWILVNDWANIVRNAGIKQIDGRIIGDPRIFGGHGTENISWTMDDIGSDYGAGPNGLSYAENSMKLLITAGRKEGDPVKILMLGNEVPWMNITSTAITTAPNTGSDLYWVNTHFGPFGELRGHIAAGSSRTIECSNRFGAYTCAYILYRYLNFKGIPVNGYADITPQGIIREDLLYSDYGPAAPAVSSLKPIGSVKSAALSSMVRHTNGTSDNFFAETLMKMVSLHRCGSVQQDSCVSSIRNILKEMGLDTHGCRIVDGSGLSRKNYVSPEFFVDFLGVMEKDPVFVSSLPVPGDQASTLKSFMYGKPSSVRQRICCKSGSMNGIRCYVGYIESADGKPEKRIRFSIMTNNSIAGTAAVTREIEKILMEICQ